MLVLNVIKDEYNKDIAFLCKVDDGNEIGCFAEDDTGIDSWIVPIKGSKLKALCSAFKGDIKTISLDREKIVKALLKSETIEILGLKLAEKKKDEIILCTNIIKLRDTGCSCTFMLKVRNDKIGLYVIRSYNGKDYVSDCGYMEYRDYEDYTEDYNFDYVMKFNIRTIEKCLIGLYYKYAQMVSMGPKSNAQRVFESKEILDFEPYNEATMESMLRYITIDVAARMTDSVRACCNAGYILGDGKLVLDAESGLDMLELVAKGYIVTNGIKIITVEEDLTINAIAKVSANVGKKVNAYCKVAYSYIDNSIEIICFIDTEPKAGMIKKLATENNMLEFLENDETLQPVFITVLKMSPKVLGSFRQVVDNMYGDNFDEEVFDIIKEVATE